MFLLIDLIFKGELNRIRSLLICLCEIFSSVLIHPSCSFLKYTYLALYVLKYKPKRNMYLKDDDVLFFENPWIMATYSMSMSNCNVAVACEWKCSILNCRETNNRGCMIKIVQFFFLNWNLIKPGFMTWDHLCIMFLYEN